MVLKLRKRSAEFCLVSPDCEYSKLTLKIRAVNPTTRYRVVIVYPPPLLELIHHDSFARRDRLDVAGNHVLLSLQPTGMATRPKTIIAPPTAPAPMAIFAEVERPFLR